MKSNAFVNGYLEGYMNKQADYTGADGRTVYTEAPLAAEGPVTPEEWAAHKAAQAKKKAYNALPTEKFVTPDQLSPEVKARRDARLQAENTERIQNIDKPGKAVVEQMNTRDQAVAAQKAKLAQDYASRYTPKGPAAATAAPAVAAAPVTGIQNQGVGKPVSMPRTPGKKSNEQNILAQIKAGQAGRQVVNTSTKVADPYTAAQKEQNNKYLADRDAQVAQSRNVADRQFNQAVAQSRPALRPMAKGPGPGKQMQEAQQVAKIMPGGKLGMKGTRL